MTMALAVNLITQQMTSFFHLLFKFYSLVYFIFAKFSFVETPLHYVLVFKIRMHMPKMRRLSQLKKDIFFLHIIC